MNFKDANAIGKVGEVLVIRWLENTGWLVTDCSDHKFFQDSGIDIVASKGGGSIQLT